jgi:hypothetical protein
VRLTMDPRDAERFGCAESLPLDLTEITIADMNELADRFDFEPETFPPCLFGQRVETDAGVTFKAPPWQRWALVWLALRLNGFEVTWAEAGKARAGRLRWFVGDDEPVEGATDG